VAPTGCSKGLTHLGLSADSHDDAGLEHLRRGQKRVRCALVVAVALHVDLALGGVVGERALVVGQLLQVPDGGDEASTVDEPDVRERLLLGQLGVLAVDCLADESGDSAAGLSG